MRRRALSVLARKRVIVHTLDDRSVRGSVHAEFPDGIVLEAAEWLDDKGRAEPLPGRAFVPAANVSWVQED